MVYRRNEPACRAFQACRRSIGIGFLSALIDEVKYTFLAHDRAPRFDDAEPISAWELVGGVLKHESDLLAAPRNNLRPHDMDLRGYDAYIDKRLAVLDFSNSVEGEDRLWPTLSVVYRCSKTHLLENALTPVEVAGNRLLEYSNGVSIHGPRAGLACKAAQHFA